MSHLYNEPDGSRRLGLSLLLGLVSALLIFLLVPLTQLFQSPPRSLTVDRLEASIRADPPPPAQDVVAEVPEMEAAAPPQLEVRVPMPRLEPLELSLDAGVGGAFRVELGLDLNFETESAQQLVELFGFDQLDEVPSLIRRGAPKRQQSRAYQQLMRKNTKKTVALVVLVNERGAIEVIDVLSATHSELIPAAKEAAEASRFSAPIRNGKSVRAKYTWTLTF